MQLRSVPVFVAIYRVVSCRFAVLYVLVMQLLHPVAAVALLNAYLQIIQSRSRGAAFRARVFIVNSTIS